MHYGDDLHWVGDDFGVLEWTLTGTAQSGQPIEVRGVDLLEFVQGKIILKDSSGKSLRDKPAKRQSSVPPNLYRMMIMDQTTPQTIDEYIAGFPQMSSEAGKDQDDHQKCSPRRRATIKYRIAASHPEWESGQFCRLQEAYRGLPGSNRRCRS